MAITGYTVESMAYLTSGMVDRGEDCSLEAAMCKVCLVFNCVPVYMGRSNKPVLEIFPHVVECLRRQLYIMILIQSIPKLLKIIEDFRGRIFVRLPILFCWDCNFNLDSMSDWHNPTLRICGNTLTILQYRI